MSTGKNPGASGLAPDITWNLPDGFEAGEIEFPTPARIEMAGLMSYAFEDSVTFIVPIQAHGDPEPGQMVTIGAELFYLICKDVCLPGKAVLSIELPVSDTASLGENAGLFEAARASQPSEDLPFLVSMTGVRDGSCLSGSVQIQLRPARRFPNRFIFTLKRRASSTRTLLSRI